MRDFSELALAGQVPVATATSRFQPRPIEEPPRTTSHPVPRKRMAAVASRNTLRANHPKSPRFKRRLPRRFPGRQFSWCSRPSPPPSSLARLAIRDAVPPHSCSGGGYACSRLLPASPDVARAALAPRPHLVPPRPRVLPLVGRALHPEGNFGIRPKTKARGKDRVRCKPVWERARSPLPRQRNNSKQTQLT